WQLDKQKPTKRSDRGMCGQYLATLDITRLLYSFGWCVRGVASSRLHLRKMRQIRIPKHETDIWVGNQPAVGVYEVSAPAITDLDLRDHIPNKPQIDFCNGNAGVTSATRKRQSQIRLGLAPEIDWPVVDFAGNRLAKFGVL